MQKGEILDSIAKCLGILPLLLESQEVLQAWVLEFVMKLLPGARRGHHSKLAR
jgi:hypothetical protein